MRAHFTLIGLIFASTARADTFNLTPGVTPLSHDIYSLHMIIFWICVLIGIVVFGVMLHAVIYHRKSLGVKAANFHEHTWIELTWTIIPLLILISMAVPATRVLITMNNTEKEDITIKVTGYQWKWRYEYIDQGINFFSNMNTPFDQLNNKVPKTSNYLRTVDHPLVVPIHKKIRFLMTSNDVIHTWSVLSLGVKRDALPGFINEAWARINKPGTYYGQCSELCGLNHSYMIIVVNAVTEEDFQKWVAAQKGLPLPTTAAGTPSVAIVPTANAAPASAPASKPTTQTVATTQPSLEETIKHGEQIYLSTCSVCHQPTGVGMPPTFPALKGDPIVNGPVDQHIHTVLNGKPGTAMQAFRDQLSDDDLAAVITYERNSWGNNTKTLVTAEQVKAAK